MDFGIDTHGAAVIAIDLHRGHLDMSVATMPTSPEIAARVIAANNRFFRWCREVGVPVIHLVTGYRDAAEIKKNPFWRMRADDPTATRKNVLRHNIIGGPGCTVMAQLLSSEDIIIDTKKRYDCFVATDLDFVLKTLTATTVFITGVNTNSCVLATSVSANVKDYNVIVVEDCVDTMDGNALHQAGLDCIRTAFGLVMTTDEIITAAAERAPAAKVVA
jgi:nicotinamidase-related amidase